MAGQPAAARPPRPRRRWLRFVPRWVRWTVLIVIALVFFRRVVAWALLAVLSAGLHLFSANVHLPHVSFGWPWSSTTTNTLVGPLVLREDRGNRQARARHGDLRLQLHPQGDQEPGLPAVLVLRDVLRGRPGVGHGRPEPGPAWWKPSTGHYQLRVLGKPAGSTPGQLAITMALPLPQLPQSVHDVSVDNTLSQPTQINHSWTYPGLGCGELIQPQFSQSVLYAQAQTEAFDQATTLPRVTGPLIAAAEKEATTIIRDNFIVPTVGALDYTVTSFTIRWVPAAG